jgi:hypothetical protein
MTYVLLFGRLQMGMSWTLPYASTGASYSVQ